MATPLPKCFRFISFSSIFLSNLSMVTEICFPCSGIVIHGTTLIRSLYPVKSILLIIYSFPSPKDGSVFFSYQCFYSQPAMIGFSLQIIPSFTCTMYLKRGALFGSSISQWTFSIRPPFNIRLIFWALKPTENPPWKIEVPKHGRKSRGE